MDQPINNKVIQIVSKEESKTKNGKNSIIRITDQDNVKFIFYKKKGVDTAQEMNSSQYEQFKNMGLDEGSFTRIGYVIENYNSLKGIPQTSNKIISFQETSEKPTAHTPTQTPVRTQPQRSFTDISIMRQVAFKGAIELICDGIITLPELGKYTDDFERLLRREALPNPLSPSIPSTAQLADKVTEETWADELAKDIVF